MTLEPAYADCAVATLIDGDRADLVVALHGLTATRRQPLALLEGIDLAGFGVLAPDLRAHGDTPLSGLPDAFTPARLAADVTELVDHLGLRSRRICVLGISLGATVALELLRAGTLVVAGGIFVRPAHAAGRPAHLAVNTLIADLLRDDPATALDRLVASETYLAVEAVSPSGAESLRRKTSEPGAAARVMRLDAGSRWTAFDRGERIAATIPSLVVGMPEDPLHPLGVAEEWHARIAGSSLVVVPSRDRDPAGAAAATRLAIAGLLGNIARPLEPAG